VLDPFRIVRHYDDYSKNMHIIPNRDFVSTEVFLSNRQKYHYNSFILGSSRTVAFKTETWMKYLEPGSRPFVFDANGESIFGINKKIQYIDSLKDNIKNCLIILCVDTSFSYDSDQDGHLFMKHPSVAGTSWINFYAEFIKAYFDPKFLLSYYKYILTQKYDSSMRRFIEPSKINYDPITNDIFLVDKDNEICTDLIKYYENKDNIFYKRDPTVIFSKTQISEKQLNMLKNIKDIFAKHHTNYKIVVSPLYDQIQMNPNDLDLLKEIFGSDNVFDFSGKNSITENMENYYENKHYRPVVGNLIIHGLYTNPNFGHKRELTSKTTATTTQDNCKN
jgi:hypothetical protein